MIGGISASGDSLSQAASTGMFQVGTATSLVGALLLVPGVVALSMRLWERSRRWAIAAVAGGTISASALVATMYGGAFMSPSLAAEAPTVLDQIEAGTLGGPALLGATLSPIVQAIGLAVLAIAALRTAAYSRWAVIVLLVGTALLPFAPVGAIFIVIAVIWMGVALFRAENIDPRVTDSDRELVGV